MTGFGPFKHCYPRRGGADILQRLKNPRQADGRSLENTNHRARAALLRWRTEIIDGPRGPGALGLTAEVILAKRVAPLRARIISKRGALVQKISSYIRFIYILNTSASAPLE